MRGQYNYPSAVREAEQVLRDVQGISGEGVTIPTWLFAGGCGLLAGIILGPAIQASVVGSGSYLAKKTSQRFGG